MTPRPESPRYTGTIRYVKHAARVLGAARSKTRTRLGRDTAWMTYGYTASLLLQAIYFVALARLLRAAGFGTFASGLALVSVISPFVGLGAGNLLVMFGARDPSTYRRNLGTAIAFIGATGVILFGAVVGISLVVFRSTPVESVIVPLAISELFFARLVELASQCFQVHGRINWTSQLTVSTSACRLVALGFFALAFRSAQPGAWAYCYLAATFVAAAIASAAALSILGLPTFDGIRIRYSASQGFFFSLGIASRTVYGDIDKVMLARLSTLTVAGYYTAAYRILTLAFAPVRAVAFAANTRLFRAGTQGPGAVWIVVRRMLVPVLGYAVLITAALALAAPTLPFILGRSYTEAADVLRFLAVMPIIQAVHQLFGDALMGLGRQGLRSALQLGTAGLNIGLNILWIPKLSWGGAVLATIVAEGSLACASVALLVTLVRHSSSDEPLPQ